ncbi:MAG TPA: hypothetical protein VN408_05515 [Actinoplanes sp.]|nr:hypothetical protein [Actinoplanes sp.]
MTVTPPRNPPRETNGAGTRSARNRNRRRLNASSSASSEGRYPPVNQGEPAPPRRRGRHAAEEPEPGAAEITDIAFPAPDVTFPASGVAFPAPDLTFPASDLAFPGPGVAVPAPAWDPWTTDPGPAGPPPGRTDPLDGPAFRSEYGPVLAEEENPAFRSGAGPILGLHSPDPALDSPRHNPGLGSHNPLHSPGLGLHSGAAPVVSRRRRSAASSEPEPAKAWTDTGERDRAWELWAATGDGEQPLPDPDQDPAGPEAERSGFQDRGRWAHARRTHSVFLKAALVRCALYLGPVSVAVAAVGSLSRVAWPVTALILFFGWTAAQGLTSVGVSLAGRGGPTVAARAVATGFAAIIGLWCALVWVAPDELLGPDRMLATIIGAGGLLTVGTVTAALVTRSEHSVAAWFLPCWLLAAATMAGAAGITEATLVPVETLLPAAIVATAVRAFRPAVLTAGSGRIRRLSRAEYRRGVAHAVIGAAQAVCVVLLWRGGPAVMPLPAALPLLLAVPLMECLIGWHTTRIDTAPDTTGTPRELRRRVRTVTAVTVAVLVPPLAAGSGLLAAAYRLPDGLAHLPGARDAVLVLAAGTLLSGVFAITFLLAARSRHGIAAALAALPPAATTVLAVSTPPAGLLPAAVTALAATHLAGLLIVALTAADFRRTP